mmetsp:Transcript_63376/g.151252  ORF Transcript_63376/g.151252 Transcript_63376/m.151252 type:complete len:481 (+) Transcript_63376:58-1500(+)
MLWQRQRRHVAASFPLVCLLSVVYLGGAYLATTWAFATTAGSDHQRATQLQLAARVRHDPTGRLPPTTSHVWGTRRPSLQAPRPIRPRTGRQAAKGEATTSEMAEAQAADLEERVRFLSMTLLSQVDEAKEAIRDAESAEKSGSDVDKARFLWLLEELDIGASRDEGEALFEALTPGNTTSFKVTELKERIRSSGAITEMYSESLRNVLFTVAVALLVAAGFAVFRAPSYGLDFLTGYLVEDSLSVDNLFVFLLLFRYFKVPPSLQSYCLNIGIAGAIVLRALFIVLGLAAISVFRPVLLVFGIFLLYSSYKLWYGLEDGDDEDDGPPPLVQEVLSWLPASSKFQGDSLTVVAPDGKVLFTPLALCIIAIEISDILFAVDSVPAVFAVTDDPAVVYTSNLAAILGLRSLFQVLSVAVQDIVYLEKGVSLVLAFVGLKLVLCVFGLEFGSTISTAVIVLTLGTSILLSQFANEEEEAEATA